MEERSEWSGRLLKEPFSSSPYLARLELHWLRRMAMRWCVRLYISKRQTSSTGAKASSVSNCLLVGGCMALGVSMKWTGACLVAACAVLFVPFRSAAQGVSGPQDQAALAGTLRPLQQ